MSVGEFTASNIAVDQDKKEEEAKKRTNIDYSKIEATVSSNKELASRVIIYLSFLPPNFPYIKSQKPCAICLRLETMQAICLSTRICIDYEPYLLAGPNKCRPGGPLECGEAAEASRGHHWHKVGLFSNYRGPV